MEVNNCLRGTESVKGKVGMGNGIRLPWWSSGEESACQCRRCRFDPWSDKIPRLMEQLSPRATTTEAHAP